MDQIKNFTLLITRLNSIRSKLVFIGLVILLVVRTALQTAGAHNKGPTAILTSDTIYVAPPTGEREIDRLNIQTAFDAVKPGGIVQFKPGTYMLGGGARLTVPDITVLGHPDGTILRGCDPEAFAVEESQVASVVFGCTGLYIQAERQTIRGLTFEYIWHGIVIGSYPTSEEEASTFWSSDEEPVIYPAAGQLIEKNTFRAVANGLRVLGTGSELSVVQDNDFIDVFHAIGIYGAPLHFLNNRITVVDPEGVPFSKHPGSAIIVSPGNTDCTGHVVAGNYITGYPDPIYVNVDRGETCKDVEIRDNTIHATGVKIPEAWAYKPTIEDSTMVGVPITLMNRIESRSERPEAEAEGILEDIKVHGNKIFGAEGMGILVQNVTRSQITDNTISGIKPRNPFPGITWDGYEQNWETANGSGIWVSPGSSGNEIVGNTFKNIFSAAVFIEGDNNRLEVFRERDSIRNLGTGNLISKIAVPDTTYYTILIDGHKKAKRKMWQEDEMTWHYDYEGDSYDSYHFPRNERLVLDAEGFPVDMEINGQRNFWDKWIERFERRDGAAQWTVHTESNLGPEWSRKLDDGEAEITGQVYYAPVHPVHDPGVLARLLLNQPDRKLPLLPGGTARLELIKERKIEKDQEDLNIHLYAIHGLDLRPTYVWLDEKKATFADEWSILAGWEEIFPELRMQIEEALADFHYQIVKDLIPAPRIKPLAIHGARLFDSETHTVHSAMTILIEDNRITAVGPEGTIDIPEGAEMIDAAGQMAMPGLWDMHTHHGISETYLELMAPLYLAGGITTARDLGSPTVPMLSLRKRIEEGEALGARLLLAGWIEGSEGRPTGPLVSNAAEARAAVDRFAELGYVQIKIYGSLSPDLVPVVIEHAKKQGLRVSGHIPQGLTWQEAIEMGIEEIQHLGYVFEPLLSDFMTDLISEPTPERLNKYNKAQAEITSDSEEVQEMISLLASKNIAVDPTLAVLDAQGLEPQGWVKRVVNKFPTEARRQIFDLYLFGYWPLNPLRQETFDNQRDIVRAMHQAGVPILPGSDMEIAGFSLHRELEIYTEAGIPAPEVLNLATLGAARVMGMDDELGTIEPGKLADLILVDGDPTKNISDLRRVMSVIKDGRVYKPAAIYKALGIEPCCEDW